MSFKIASAIDKVVAHGGGEARWDNGRSNGLRSKLRSRRDKGGGKC